MYVKKNKTLKKDSDQTTVNINNPLGPKITFEKDVDNSTSIQRQKL